MYIQCAFKCDKAVHEETHGSATLRHRPAVWRTKTHKLGNVGEPLGDFLERVKTQFLHLSPVVHLHILACTVLCVARTCNTRLTATSCYVHYARDGRAPIAQVSSRVALPCPSPSLGCGSVALGGWGSLCCPAVAPWSIWAACPPVRCRRWLAVRGASRGVWGG